MVMEANSNNDGPAMEESIQLRISLAMLANPQCLDCTDPQPEYAVFLPAPQEPEESPEEQVEDSSAASSASCLVGLCCVSCSTYHRSLGAHISRVKSCTSDHWSETEIVALEESGNEVTNSVYESILPLRRPPPSSEESSESEEADEDAPEKETRDSIRLEFIQSKYAQQKFYSSGARQRFASKQQSKQRKKLQRQSSSHSFGQVQRQSSGNCNLPQRQISVTGNAILQSSPRSAATPADVPTSLSLPSPKKNTNRSIQPKLIAPPLLASSTFDYHHHDEASAPAMSASAAFEYHHKDKVEPPLLPSATFDNSEKTTPFDPFAVENSPVHRHRKKNESLEEQLQVLLLQKHAAVQEEEYLLASELQTQIVELRKQLEEQQLHEVLEASNEDHDRLQQQLQALNREKEQAVIDEDYIKASQLKQELEELQKDIEYVENKIRHQTNQQPTKGELDISLTAGSTLTNEVAGARTSLDSFFGGRNNSPMTDAHLLATPKGAFAKRRNRMATLTSFLEKQEDGASVDNHKKKHHSTRGGRSVVSAPEESEVGDYGYKALERKHRKDFSVRTRNTLPEDMAFEETSKPEDDDYNDHHRTPTRTAPKRRASQEDIVGYPSPTSIMSPPPPPSSAPRTPNGNLVISKSKMSARNRPGRPAQLQRRRSNRHITDSPAEHSYDEEPPPREHSKRRGVASSSRNLGGNHHSHGGKHSQKRSPAKGSKSRRNLASTDDRSEDMDRFAIPSLNDTSTTLGKERMSNMLRQHAKEIAEEDSAVATIGRKQSVLSAASSSSSPTKMKQRKSYRSTRKREEERRSSVTSNRQSSVKSSLAKALGALEGDMQDIGDANHHESPSKTKSSSGRHRRPSAASGGRHGRHATLQSRSRSPSKAHRSLSPSKSNRSRSSSKSHSRSRSPSKSHRHLGSSGGGGDDASQRRGRRPIPLERKASMDQGHSSRRDRRSVPMGSPSMSNRKALAAT